MYDEDLLRPPADEDEMWLLLREHFMHVRHILWELPLETKEDALSNKFHRDIRGKTQRDGLQAVRYREVGEELDQREYFLNLGRELLPEVHFMLDQKKLTPAFVQQWGKIMFCHGYIASHVFDDSDDLFAHRNRRNGALASDRTPQRVFLARLLLWFMDEQKQTRKRAEANAAKAIWGLIGNDAGMIERIPHGFDIDWFKTLVRDCKDRDQVVSTMNQKNMKEASLRELAAMKIDGLPPIELVVPAGRP